MDTNAIERQELLTRLEDHYWRMSHLYAIRTKLQGFEGETIIYEPNYVQQKIYQAIEDGKKRIIILKPRKLGVTTGVALYLLDKAMFSPNMMCRTIAHRKQTVTELFNDIPRFAFEELKRRSPTFCPKEKYTTRSELEFIGTGSKYSIDVEARGMTPTYLHFSEIAYIDDEAKLIDSLESLSRNNVGIAESTANGKGNWFHRIFMDNWSLLQQGKEPEWWPMFFPWFVDPDNTLPWKQSSQLFFPEECLEQQRKYKNVDGSNLSKDQILWWDRKKFELKDLLPEKYPSEPEEAFLHSTGRVYPEFSTTHNVIKPVEFKDYKLAMDYGQKNPMVFAAIHQDYDGNFTMFKEFYKTECPIKIAATWLRANCPEKVDEDGYIFIDFPDPSCFNETQSNPFEYRPGHHRYSIADEFMKHKIILRPGAQNDILSGLVRVSEYIQFDPMHPHPYKRNENGNPIIGSPRFFVTQNCKNTINEFELYRWPKEKTGALDQSKYERPIKKDDHACLTALITCEVKDKGSVPINKVKIGDMVKSASGLSKVVNSKQTGVKKIRRIDLEGGNFIEGTDNHPIFVIGKGLVSMKSVKYNDHICTKPVNQDRMAAEYEKNCGSMKCHTIDTQMLQTQNLEEVEETISQTLLQRKDIIVNFGKNIMVKFQMGLTSTILMIISLIMKLKILSVYRKGITQESQSQKEIFRSNVSLAIKNLEPKILEKNGDQQDSVQITVEVNSTTKMEGTTSLEPVLFVEQKHLKQKVIQLGVVPSRVLSNSVKGQEKPVYNLETEDGTYYANSILVSNCDAIRYALLSDAPALEYDVHAGDGQLPDSVRSLVERVAGHNAEIEMNDRLEAHSL